VLVGERRPDRAGGAALVAVVEVIDVVVVEVDGLLDETQAERHQTKIQIVLRIVDGGGDVVETENRHLTSIIQPPAKPSRRASWRRCASYLIPTTIESGPTRCSTRMLEKPASFIHSRHCAPV